VTPARTPPALRIGELARATGFSDKTLRFYDEIGLVRPSARTGAGYRLYDEAAAERLRFVRKAQGLGLRLDDIRAILEIADAGRVPCEHVLALVERQLNHIEGQLRGLRSLRKDLMDLRGKLKDALASGDVRPGSCPCFDEGAHHA
jgi:DNA-binding transcriptional MerR regulator